jgi:hypothetical protein
MVPKELGGLEVDVSTALALFEALAMYAWHGRHHAAHIRNALSR